MRAIKGGIARSFDRLSDRGGAMLGDMRVALKSPGPDWARSGSVVPYNAKLAETFPFSDWKLFDSQIGGISLRAIAKSGNWLILGGVGGFLRRFNVLTRAWENKDRVAGSNKEMGVAANGAGVVIAVPKSGTEVWRSTDDGNTWAAITAGVVGRGTTGDGAVYFCNGVFYIVQSGGSPSSQVVQASTDSGLTWQNVTFPTGYYGGYFSQPAFANGKWYAATQAILLSSVNGVDFNVALSNVSGNANGDLLFANGLLYLRGLSAGYTTISKSDAALNQVNNAVTYSNFVGRDFVYHEQSGLFFLVGSLSGAAAIASGPDAQAMTIRSGGAIPELQSLVIDGDGVIWGYSFSTSVTTGPGIYSFSPGSLAVPTLAQIGAAAAPVAGADLYAKVK